VTRNHLLGHAIFRSILPEELIGGCSRPFRFRTAAPSYGAASERLSQRKGSPMWRTILTAIFLSISFVAAGVAKDPDALSDNLMVSPSYHIPRAPIGHRQPTSTDLVAPKPASGGTVGAKYENWTSTIGSMLSV